MAKAVPTRSEEINRLRPHQSSNTKTVGGSVDIGDEGETGSAGTQKDNPKTTPNITAQSLNRLLIAVSVSFLTLAIFEIGGSNLTEDSKG
jgi:hypothetical protein